MKNSVLFDALRKRAEALRKENNKTGVDVYYFVFVALSYACKQEAEIKDVDAEESFKLTNTVLGKFNKAKDLKLVYDAMQKDLKEDTKNSLLPVVIFNRIEMDVTSAARKNGTDVVRADDIINAIFKENIVDINLKKYYALGNEEVKAEVKPDVKPDVKPEEKKDTAASNEKKNEEKKDSDPFAWWFDGDKPDASKKESKEKSFFDEINNIKDAQKKLLSIIHGQDYAVNNLISGCFQASILSASQKNNPKPKATFLFAGPPGTGKTFLAEQAAEVLGLPFRRFDMSEYCEKESNLQFAGSDSVYKNGKAGNVTDFVAKNPKSILLFDEIEKAHLNVIYLFLQILDAGRLRDNYSNEIVSFKDTIIIMTTNVGKKLYDEVDVCNLSGLPKKQILSAISTEINPQTNAPAFPAAICSRFASGNVIMFNRLEAHHLYKIAKKEFDKYAEGFKKETKIKIESDPDVLYALLFSEGGSADARTVRGKASNFFCQETYELFRLMTAEERNAPIEGLKKIKFDVTLPEDPITRALFEDDLEPKVLIFASEDIKKDCQKLISGDKVYYTDDIETAKDLLFNNDISLILCDVTCGMKDTMGNVLNVEDVDSIGTDFFAYAAENVDKPLYVLEKNKNDINQEEVLSLARGGARGVICVHGDKKYSFKNEIIKTCNMASQQGKLNMLARSNKILSFSTAQRLNEDLTEATITLFDFRLKVAPDVDDMKTVLSDVSKPTTKFTDVIGANDAKEELKYFTAYLKNPIEYVRKGVRAPKGILLYGPPGTGKTMLAKAMAGESDVSFIAVDGNDFLKTGAEGVHQVFRVARKYAPAVLFIDEIDSVAKDRQTSYMGEATGSILTAFLTEMDGFKTQANKPVFMLAATNYSVDPSAGRSIDPALLRRFDRRIMVDLPNKAERLEFIQKKIAKHQNVKISDEQLDNIAIRSANMSLADIDSIIELALRNCIKNNNLEVDDDGLEEAFESFNNGEAKKYSLETIEKTARHEAGHALICWLNGETPSYLTIVARAGFGGYMQHGDREERFGFTKNELLDRIRTSLAGRAAEMVYYGEDGISTGASSDLASATKIAYNMICVYGMDESIGLSTIDVSTLDESAFERVKQRVDEILKAECDRAFNIIKDNKPAIDELVKILLEKNQMKGNEIDKVLSKFFSNR